MDRMERYCVSSFPYSDGRLYEVHALNGRCTKLPNPDKREPIGEYTNYREAVKVARRFHSRVIDCYDCNPEFHRSAPKP